MTDKSDKDVVTIDWDGGSYTGEVSDGVPLGQGTLTRPDGTKYVGEYKDGVPHGQGKVFAPDNTLLQEGEWFEGEFNETVSYGFSYPSKGTKKTDVIIKREKAIEAAYKNSNAGDIVLIAGKGHEDKQITKNKIVKSIFGLIALVIVVLLILLIY